MSKRRKRRKHDGDKARKNLHAGYDMLHDHPLFYDLARSVWIEGTWDAPYPENGWVVATSRGNLAVHPERVAEPEEWLYVLAHALLHYGLDHFERRSRPWEWNVACDVVVARFLRDLKLGRAPLELRHPVDCAIRSEVALYEEFCLRGIPESLLEFGTAGRGRHDMVFIEGPIRIGPREGVTYVDLLSRGLARAVRSAVNVAGGAEGTTGARDRSNSRAERARRWFMSHYPLLGALAASFEIVDDRILCARMDVHVAAVCDATREVYLNSAAALSDEELRFVMAHELLHVGLRHGARCRGRDPFLWNVACDYVINGWLIEMSVGDIPSSLLYDPDLKGESAESVYDRIVLDMRRARKLRTLRGKGIPDILPGPSSGIQHDGIDLDEFYRRCLEQGLIYHHEQGRGTLPAGLIEEIRALSQPPIAWDVELARWFDEHFRPIEKIRTYARASRRQSSTPDIPRPRLVEPPGVRDGRTYGVVLDTSGSMDRVLLAKALGAIASYSVSRDVHAARVVFCDAHAYDQGYMAPEDIAGRVKVRGRGGTILQPGISLLEKARDFPKDAPLLIITDGQCDHVRTRREHACLPFQPKGEVFRIE